MARTSLKSLAKLFALDELSYSDIYDFASQQLNSGTFTDILNDIYMEGSGYGTCHTPNIYDLFKRLLDENQVQVPEKGNLILEILRDELNNIVSGNTCLEEGCRNVERIHSKYVDEFALEKIVGSCMGVEYILSWNRELFDCDTDGNLSYYSHLSREDARTKILYHLKVECERWFDLNLKSFELNDTIRHKATVKMFAKARFTNSEKNELYSTDA